MPSSAASLESRLVIEFPAMHDRSAVRANAALFRSRQTCPGSSITPSRGRPPTARAYKPRPILNTDVGGIIAFMLLPDRYSGEGSSPNRLSMRTADCAPFARLLEIEAAARRERANRYAGSRPPN